MINNNNNVKKAFLSFTSSNRVSLSALQTFINMTPTLLGGTVPTVLIRIDSSFKSL
jgi:hypothetical protein